MSTLKTIHSEEIDRLVKEIKLGVDATFTAMLGVKPEALTHKVSKNSHEHRDVTGTMEMTQEKAEGAFLLSFPRATIFAMLSKMYGRPLTEVDGVVSAGVGELTNIIYGVFKTNLNKNGYQLKMGLPNVVIGDQQTLIPSPDAETLVIPFSTPVGEFRALIYFYPQLKKTA